MEKLNTFLRLVKTVLVPYLKTANDSIHMLFLKSICIYTFYNVIDYVTLSMFYATDFSFICLLTCVDNTPQCEDAY